MSKIEWTEQTWNPIIGCSKISLGCKNCYAETMAHRLSNIKKTSYYNYVIDFISEKWNGKTYFEKSQLEKPLIRKKPTMYFVCSMSDLFHESVPFEWIDIIFSIMSDCDQHIYQLLTKRPDRMRMFFDWKCDQVNKMFSTKWLPKDNIWLGVTAENQEQANKRIPVLLQIPAKVKFVSIEPMLGLVNLTKIESGSCEYNLLEGWGVEYGLTNHILTDGPKLNWVICGGESGPNARPMHPVWVRSLRDQCETANVPFFFKQWGEWAPNLKPDEFLNIPGKIYLGYKNSTFEDGQIMAKVGKKKAGCLLDGKEYKQFPKSNL